MTKKYSTKQALISSILVLALCCTMLVGTTFAWFTDSVSSANNVIKSGNLDVELEYWNGSAWVDVSGKSDILTNEYWEPGVTEIAYLRVANAGSLALKYQLGINIISEIAGKNSAGQEFKLSDYIFFDVIEGVNGETGAYANRDAALAAIANGKKISAGYTKASAMAPDEEIYLALVVYMPTSVGNEANHNGTDEPEIELGINVIATQLANENDSFGNDYDNGAVYFENVSPTVKVPQNATESETLTTDGNDAMEVEVPANVLNNLSSSVTGIALGHSEIVYNSSTNTVVIDSVEIVDQNGQVVDLTDNTTPITVTFAVPFADGTVIDVYHDDELVAAAVIVENGKVTYEALHFCTVKLQNSSTLGASTAAELAEAVNNIEDGGSIILTNDIVFGENYRVNNNGWFDGLSYDGDKSFTIDLNGKTITNDSAINDYVIFLKNSGAKANSITFKNGTIIATSSAYSTIATSTSSTQKITVNLDNVDLIGNNSNGSVIKARAGAELNVMAGTTITGTDNYVCIETVNATTNVYDGAELYQNGTTSYCGSLIGVSNNGTTNVYGGYGKSAKGCFIAMTSGGTINVYGGEWTANGDGTYANGNDSVLIAQSDKRAASIINVYGGSFFGGYNCYGNVAGDAQINIFEGEFNSNPASYVAGGSTSHEIGGKYTVFPAGTSVVTTAEELKAAINGAADVNVIYLAADIEVSEVLLIGKSLTIEGNGHKVTSSANRIFRITTSDVDVVFNDVNMVSVAVRVSTNDIRGISVDSPLTNIKLTLNDCSVDFKDESAHDWSYAINVVGGTDTGHVITVNGGTYEAANAININGAGHTILVNNAVLDSLYKPNSVTSNYGACIYVAQNESTTLEVTDTVFNCTGGNAVAINAGYTPTTTTGCTDNTSRNHNV